MKVRLAGPALAIAALGLFAGSCEIDRAPAGLRRTPSGSGAAVRFNLGHQPLPDIPLPNDVATWADPTSRTGLRLNASLVAPTNLEREARERFSQMEGWGTFSPMSVSFDVDASDPAYAGYTGPALDIDNVKRRHQGDDYDFADDAIYVVNLTTGVPVVLDVGAGNFNYTLKNLDEYWANDTRATERNLLFDTIDESKRGAITKATFRPEDDTDFDGMLDVPNLDDPYACPEPSACDRASNPSYGNPSCFARRQTRDRCIADHLLTFYERETDTLLFRPLLPLEEMTRYAVVLTDRLVDGKGHAVKSPFEFVYHDTMEAEARRVRDVINDPTKKAYFGDLTGTGLDHVGFVWSFTTQPTVDDMVRLRDGLYGKGPFARWAEQYPPAFEVQRLVGLTAGVTTRPVTDSPGWPTSTAGKKANCPSEAKDLFIVKHDDIQPILHDIVTLAFGLQDGPDSELLLREFDYIDHFVVGTFKSPFLLEGGPKGIDPNAAFDLNYMTGEGQEDVDTVPFLLVVPKETAEHKQPFDVDIYGHGYTGNFTELFFYAGNMAQHGIATIGIDAVGHGLVFTDPLQIAGAQGLLAERCAAPFYDALTLSRARDLNNDGVPDSGGDFWSSYLFHTRDGVRQSVLDHIQLVRILRSFGTPQGQMLCRSAATGWSNPETARCDVNGDGKTEVAGDFDGDGVPDVGGPDAHFGTWGESLGGVLSSIHGALDPNVSVVVPGSGGAGLTDVGVRSFQGGVVEAVLLRLWGPLLVTVPATERTACTPDPAGSDTCTVCGSDEISMRWVVPDVNATGELEIGCFSPTELANTTVFVDNASNGEVRCASPDAEQRLRVGIPSSYGDAIEVDFYEGAHQVMDYASCNPLIAEGTKPKLSVRTWGRGRFASGSTNQLGTETCGAPTCSRFQGHFAGQGEKLVAPGDGLGEIRQTPAFRRFIELAQAALEPGDPASFAPYYSMRPMVDPWGKAMAPHAVLTLNTIGDMNVPINTGIAFSRAAGALPFMRPDEAAKFPEYANYVTPSELFGALGKTPNQVLIDEHVIEGIAPLARTPAGARCAASQNAKPAGATFVGSEGAVKACYPSCKDDPGCYADTHCDTANGVCVPTLLDEETCKEALFDADDLDEGTEQFFEHDARVPLRLARYARPATGSSMEEVWRPRIEGKPHGADGSWVPMAHQPLTALVDAYIVPEGVHAFANGNPCQSFDSGSYLTNLVARFFMTNGTDLYYLSHPSSHLCLGSDVTRCAYMQPK